MTNAVSYHLVTDINYVITATITPDHNFSDINFYISQLPKGKRITNVIWAVLYWFLRIGVLLFCQFSTRWAFRLSQGRRCMLADRQNTMLICLFIKLWGHSNEVKSWNTDSLDWVFFSWYPNVQKRMKYAICMSSCEARVAISVTNENDLQLSSKYLFYILETMSTESVAILPSIRLHGLRISRLEKYFNYKVFLKLHYLGCFESYMPKPGTHTMFIIGETERTSHASGDQAKIRGRRCENATDSRCMHTG